MQTFLFTVKLPPDDNVNLRRPSFEDKYDDMSPTDYKKSKLPQFNVCFLNFILPNISLAKSFETFAFGKTINVDTL